MYSRDCCKQEVVAILEESQWLAAVPVEKGTLTHVQHPRKGELLVLERNEDGSMLLCEDIRD